VAFPSDKVYNCTVKKQGEDFASITERSFKLSFGPVTLVLFPYQANQRLPAGICH
jgi:hypothetical protein